MDLSDIEQWSRRLLEREAKKRGVREPEAYSQAELIARILKHDYSARSLRDAAKLVKDVVGSAKSLVQSGVGSLASPGASAKRAFSWEQGVHLRKVPSWLEQHHEPIDADVGEAVAWTDAPPAGRADGTGLNADGSAERPSVVEAGDHDLRAPEQPASATAPREDDEPATGLHASATALNERGGRPADGQPSAAREHDESAVGPQTTSSAAREHDELTAVQQTSASAAREQDDAGAAGAQPSPVSPREHAVHPTVSAATRSAARPREDDLTVATRRTATTPREHEPPVTLTGSSAAGEDDAHAAGQHPSAAPQQREVSAAEDQPNTAAPHEHDLRAVGPQTSASAAPQQRAVGPADDRPNTAAPREYDVRAVGPLTSASAAPEHHVHAAGQHSSAAPQQREVSPADDRPNTATPHERDLRAVGPQTSASAAREQTVFGDEPTEQFIWDRAERARALRRGAESNAEQPVSQVDAVAARPDEPSRAEGSAAAAPAGAVAWANAGAPNGEPTGTRAVVTAPRSDVADAPGSSPAAPTEAASARARYAAERVHDAASRGAVAATSSGSGAVRTEDDDAWSWDRDGDDSDGAESAELRGEALRNIPVGGLAVDPSASPLTAADTKAADRSSSDQTKTPVAQKPVAGLQAPDPARPDVTPASASRVTAAGLQAPDQAHSYSTEASTSRAARAETPVQEHAPASPNENWQDPEELVQPALPAHRDLTSQSSADQSAFAPSARGATAAPPPPASPARPPAGWRAGQDDSLSTAASSAEPITNEHVTLGPNPRDGLRLRWRISDAGLARARAELGSVGELAVRIVTVKVDASSVVRAEISDHGPVDTSGHWIAPRTPQTVRHVTAVGLRNAHRFVAIAHATD